MAHAGELLPALEYLDLVVAPADVGARLAPGLRGLYAPDGEGVVPDALEVLAAVMGDDERVELAVVLEDAAAVYADNAALAVDYRLRVGYALAVEHHRPVADDDPFAEFPALAHEVVVLHEVPAVPEEGVALGYAAVDEDIVLRFYELRHRAEELELGGVARAQHGAELVYVEVRPYLEARFLAHLREQAGAEAVAVREQVALHVPVGAGLRVVLVVVPVVAVAEHEDAAAAPVELHEVAQRREAVRALLHDVPDEDERVLIAQGELREQALEVGEVRVHVRDADYPAALREAELFREQRGYHQMLRSISIWSLETPGSIRRSRKP